MKDYYSIKEASELSGVSVRRIQQSCKAHSIVGAKKINGQYRIPREAISSLYASAHRQNMPIGYSFEDCVRSGGYVDKSLLIRDVIYSHVSTTVFTRPRRFGKSLNLQMLANFFEHRSSGENLFENLGISAYSSLCENYQGRYVAIYLKFKDLKARSMEEMTSKIQSLLYAECLRNKAYFEQSQEMVVLLDKLGKCELSKGQVESLLSLLTQEIFRLTHFRSVLLIDEYDTPIIDSYFQGYYADCIAFFRNFFSDAMKDNRNVAFSFLTGITTLGKESVFSGFNSSKVDTVLDNEYAAYFGFTEKEAKQLLRRYGGYRHYLDMARYYDGYRFGREHIFNPWSVSNFINSSYEFRDYWKNTSDNALLRKTLDGEANKSSLVRLISGEPLQGIQPRINDNLPSLLEDENRIWSLLLMSGYITLDESGGFRIPNIEVAHAFQTEVLESSALKPVSTLVDAFDSAILGGDIETLQNLFKEYLYLSVSSLLATKEDFYHGFFLGLAFFLRDRYEVLSEYERGEGRSDITLKPRDKALPTIVIEMKQGNASSRELEVISTEALQQIKTKNYGFGYPMLLAYGMAFRDKEVSISSEKIS